MHVCVHACLYAHAKLHLEHWRVFIEPGLRTTDLTWSLKWKCHVEGWLMGIIYSIWEEWQNYKTMSHYSVQHGIHGVSKILAKTLNRAAEKIISDSADSVRTG